MIKIFIALLASAFFQNSLGLFQNVLAHEEELGHVEEIRTLSQEAFFRNTSLIAIAVAGFLAVFFILVAIFKKEADETFKKFLFFGILIPIILVTFYLSGSTIYLNLTSATGGPVHWHADFEIWDCGKKLDLVDPNGLSNRVGTATFHEHGDDRIHVEGVVVDTADANLGNFFRFVGGELSEDHITIPTTGGFIHRDNGDRCRGEEGFLQVFVYQTQGKVFNQKKLTDPASYVISRHGNVPPGDCVIVEFDKPKDKTDKLCELYKVAQEQGKIHGP